MRSRIITVLCLGSVLIAGSADAVRSTFTHTAVSVSNGASTPVRSANISRNFLQVQNDHATNVLYCKFGADAVVNEGIRINGAGGVVTWDTIVPTAALNCIATVGATVALVTEGVQ